MKCKVLYDRKVVQEEQPFGPGASESRTRIVKDLSDGRIYYVSGDWQDDIGLEEYIFPMGKKAVNSMRNELDENGEEMELDLTQFSEESIVPEYTMFGDPPTPEGEEEYEILHNKYVQEVSKAMDDKRKKDDVEH